jgi:hypothetical protein
MEYSPSASNLILGSIVLKVGYSLVSKWLTKKTTRELYIEKATKSFNEVELIDSALEIDDVAENISLSDKKIRVVKKRGLFRSYLVQVGKAKFGSPHRNAANILCVRKFLYDECEGHGLMKRHIAANLDFAVEMIFVPSRSELEALAVHHTRVSVHRDVARDSLGGPNTLP